MENKKLNKSVIKNIDFNSVDVEKNVESDIKEYIKDFNIDKSALDSIEIPKDLKKSVNSSFDGVKKEKRKNIRYTILDLLIVSIVILPIVGVINPKLFKNIPTIYPTLSSINKLIQIDNIKSIMGLSDDKEVVEGNESSQANTVYIKEKDITKPTSNNEAVKLIHSLANTLVKADYKWQCSEVTPKTIKLALKGVEEINDDYDRMHLRNSITKWEKGDFSNAVEVHNYVWEMLGGTVGKAEQLNNDEINKIINKYY
ncbi:DUF6241 domain-containing protein [Terrisporobacter sp.]